MKVSTLLATLMLAGTLAEARVYNVTVSNRYAVVPPTCIDIQSLAAWTSNTAYSAGALSKMHGRAYMCQKPGTSSNTVPAFGVVGAAGVNFILEEATGVTWIQCPVVPRVGLYVYPTTSAILYSDAGAAGGMTTSPTTPVSFLSGVAPQDPLYFGSSLTTNTSVIQVWEY